MRIESDCELCDAARLTEWFHEDDICWIAECEACATPMVVWREHGADPDDGARDHMLSALDAVVARLYGDYRLDGDRRSIPDHWHVHARPPTGFMGHGWRRLSS